MRAVVTGAAGFIGSHLVESLLDDQHDVLAIDCFTDYYDVALKQANLTNARAHDRCTFVDADLRTADLGELLRPGDVLFHQAGQPGVRLSWGERFGDYEALNIATTQRLLEAAKEIGLAKFVFASSSSIYGDAVRYPTTEDDVPRPMSPYGVTKLAAEHLCSLYGHTWGVPTVALRYFTVFGPRQRPDMAFHKLIHAALTGIPFPVYGDGSQIRDFTYVSDVVAANRLAAATELPPGTIMNIAGGGATSLSSTIKLVGDLVGTEVTVDRQPARAGDVDRTGGSIDAAQEAIGWKPSVPLADGLAAQLEWMRNRVLANEDLA